jgi:hypothetical protein
MEKETATKKAKSKTSQGDKIKQAYMEYVLENGSRPASIFKFVKDLKIKEDAFYEHYNSFENVEKDIWAGMLHQTVEAIQAEEVYDAYSAREKLLAFYYTLIEVMKSNRSYILETIPKGRKPEMLPYFLEDFKKAFDEFIADVLLEAQETEEVKTRPYISNRYKDGIWIQVLFVLRFWIKDDSKGFEKTDAAIEKAVNLSFDLMGRGPLDAMVDFAKFLYQNK